MQARTLPPRLAWFVHTQMGQLARDGIPEWFHGTISRGDAENLLESQPPGSFLIRVSHSHVGYTLSYKAQDCCHHYMVKVQEDGRLAMPGEDAAHASLEDLVAFHQRRPVRPHGELLMLPCRQKDPAHPDYEDLFLYFNALAEEAAGPEDGAGGPGSHLEAAAKQSLLRPTLACQPEDKKPCAQVEGQPQRMATSLHPTKAPLEETLLKLWRSLKVLPLTARRVQQQLKCHLEALSSGDGGPSVVNPSSKAGVDSQRPSGRVAMEDRVSRDLRTATSLGNASQLQAPGDSEVSRRATRASTWSEGTSGHRRWPRQVLRTLSSQVPGLETPEDPLPEEYMRPPPFAPGYC
ncbi:hematopoietic SH2 domain-containing protein [Ctenodactylus gundi]